MKKAFKVVEVKLTHYVLRDGYGESITMTSGAMMRPLLVGESFKVHFEKVTDGPSVAGTREKQESEAPNG